jgi:hypothetical protein
LKSSVLIIILFCLIAISLGQPPAPTNTTAPTPQPPRPPPPPGIVEPADDDTYENPPSGTLNGVGVVGNYEQAQSELAAAPKDAVKVYFTNGVANYVQKIVNSDGSVVVGLVGAPNAKPAQNSVCGDEKITGREVCDTELNSCCDETNACLSFKPAGAQCDADVFDNAADAVPFAPDTPYNDKCHSDLCITSGSGTKCKRTYTPKANFSTKGNKDLVQGIPCFSDSIRRSNRFSKRLSLRKRRGPKKKKHNKGKKTKHNANIKAVYVDRDEDAAYCDGTAICPCGSKCITA